MDYKKLKSSHKIPVVGLGTWELTGRTCFQAVKKAIELGYRHIDTAEIYGNQKEIGAAIKGFDREKLFITSKVWRSNLHYNDVLKACTLTLKELGIEYLDLYLVHWPNSSVPIEETISAMEHVYKEGKIRSFGVSNFNIPHLKEALKHAKLPISLNQVEFHPYLYQKELLEFCKKNDIAVTAYSPLARGTILKNPVMVDMANRFGKQTSQIALKWLLQKGLVVIPKASSEEHLKGNLNLFGWELSEEDIMQIGGLNKNYRIVAPSFGEFDN